MLPILSVPTWAKPPAPRPLLPSFFHPTSVVFLDDDSDAIENFRVSMPSHFVVKTFTKPELALQYVFSPKRPRFLFERCRPLTLDINFFERELSYARRFDTNCLAISNYAMPCMNGINFCRAIDNPYVHKILLTDIGEEKLAGGALNEKLIHEFFVKQDNEVLCKVIDSMELAQREYFLAVSEKINEVIMRKPPSFLTDPIFLEFFNSLLLRYNVCEYYLSKYPEGFTFLDENGKKVRLVIHTKKDFEFQYEMAIGRHAPSDLIQILDIKNKPSPPPEVPYFWKDRLGVYGHWCVCWKDYFYPADVLKGEQDYYYALIEDPPGYDKLAEDFINFLDYLEEVKVMEKEKEKSLIDEAIGR